MTTPTRRALAIFLANLLIFLLARIGLWLVYQDDFRDLETLELLRAFIHGEWFDLSVIAMVSGIPLLMMLLPFRWASHSVWLGLWSWLSYGLLVMLGLLLATDAIYFSFVHRHAGPEIAALSADPELLVDMAFGSYAWAVGLYTLASAGLFVLWRRLFHRPTVSAARFAPRLAVFVVALAGLTVLARGGLALKPIDVVDAFTDAKPATAYLTLNGPFAMSHALLNSKRVKSDFFAWDDAVQRTRQMVLAPDEQQVAGNDYPLTRARVHHGARTPNVVVLMLESWDAAHIDILRRTIRTRGVRRHSELRCPQPPGTVVHPVLRQR